MPIDAKRQAQFDLACALVAEGEALAVICRDRRAEDKEAFPAPATIMDWTYSDPELAARYARAKECRGEVHAEKVLTVAMDTKIEPNSRRIMVDALKWTASKLYPARYGDKLALGGADDLPAIRQEVQERADSFMVGIAASAARGKPDTKH